MFHLEKEKEKGSEGAVLWVVKRQACESNVFACCPPLSIHLPFHRLFHFYILVSDALGQEQWCVAGRRTFSAVASTLCAAAVGAVAALSSTAWHVDIYVSNDGSGWKLVVCCVFGRSDYLFRGGKKEEKGAVGGVRRGLYLPPSCPPLQPTPAHHLSWEWRRAL